MKTAYPAATSFIGLCGQNDLDTSFTFGVALNSANTLFAMGFAAIGNRTLSKVRVRAGKLSGTLGTSDFVCDLYAASSANKPTGSVLASSSTVSPAINSGGDVMYTFSGFSYALTHGTQYFLVFRNANGSPGSNYFYVDSMKAGQTFFKNSKGAAITWESYDAGSTWQYNKDGASNVNVEYSDGSLQGLLFEYFRYPGQGGYSVYSTRECGVKFTTGPVPIRIVGAAAHVYYTGSPTGTARIKLYEAGSLINTSNDQYFDRIGYYPICPFFFTDEVELAANTSYRITLAESTNSDTSSNRFDVANTKVFTNTENRSLVPMGGTWQGTFYDGSTWTDSDNEVSSVSLVLAEPWWGTPSGGFSARGGAAMNGGLA